MLEEIYSIKNDNVKDFSDKEKFQFFPKIINFEELKLKYKTLISNYINYDDEALVKKKVDLLSKIIVDKSKEEIFPFIKNGIPHSLRKDIYKLFLNLQEEDINSVKNLKETSDYLVVFDYLIASDARETCNNENYFLFEEGLSSMMSKFVRDTEILFEMQGIRPVPVINLPGTNSYVQFPQNGFIPYRGVTYLAAPFCYMANNPIEAYIIFRKFFSYHLSQLSSINSNENSLSSLIYNFDFYFTKFFSNFGIFLRNFQIDINLVVTGWFMTCFAEIVNVNEMFILYDIILTNKNLHFMIFIALGICHLLEKEVMALTSKDEITEALNNFYQLEFLDVVRVFIETH